jgi:hypothetical protein
MEAEEFEGVELEFEVEVGRDLVGVEERMCFVGVFTMLGDGLLSICRERVRRRAVAERVWRLGFE